MRHLLTFDCEGQRLGGSLDDGGGTTGVLIVTGGTQTRIGSHRLFERLAKALAEDGHAVLRFDRRGVGDSEGSDPGYRGNQADIGAAAIALRRQCPSIDKVVGLGLCDGATSLALASRDPEFAGLILINPWLVEAESGAPAPAAIKHHYRQQLTSLSGWKKLLTGSVSYRKLFKGVIRIAAPAAQASLAADVAQGLRTLQTPVELILARDDGTAVAAEAAWKEQAFQSQIQELTVRTTRIGTDAHTFSRPGDFDLLLDACRAALIRLSGSGSD